MTILLAAVWVAPIFVLLAIRGLMIREINARGVRPYIPPWVPQAFPFGVGAIHRELFPTSRLRRFYTIFGIGQIALAVVVIVAVIMINR